MAQGRLEQREAIKRERTLARLKQRLRAAKQQAHREVGPSPSEPKPVDAGGGSALAGFSHLENSLPGKAGIAMGSPGSRRILSAGTLLVGPAWSTSKVPIAMRILQESGGPQGLTAAWAEAIRRALTLSDNAAAISLFDDLEESYGGVGGAAAAVNEVLAEAGDTTTQVATQGRDGFTPFGQTQWSLARQGLFMSYLAAGCIVSRASSEYVLTLMGEGSSDRWGLGSSGLPAQWKGGWGPGIDGRYLARQMGVVSVGEKQAVVVLAVLPDDGAFETAQSMATSVAQFAAQAAPKFARRSDGC